MGLGKTVEVIACILCHPKPSSNHKPTEDRKTASQCSSTSQTVGAKTLTTTCGLQERCNSTPAQCDHLSQEETKVSVIEPDHKSLSDSRTTHSYSSINQTSAGEALEDSIQGCSDVKAAECVIHSQEGIDASTVTSNQMSMNDNGAANLCSAVNQMNTGKASAHSTSVKECSDSKSAECEFRSQEGTNSCTGKSDQMTMNGSGAANLYSTVNQMNTGKPSVLSTSVQGCSDSKPAECEIHSKQGSDRFTFKPDHKSLNSSGVNQTNTGKVLAASVQGHSDTKPAECETYMGTQGDTNSSTFKPDNNCGESDLDAKDASYSQNSNSSEIACTLHDGSSCGDAETINEENGDSVHQKINCNTNIAKPNPNPHYDCGKNDCDSTVVSCRQDSMCSKITCKLNDDSSCGNVEMLTGETNGLVSLNKISSSKQDSDSSRTVSFTLHSDSNCGNLQTGDILSSKESCTDQSKDLDTIQGVPEVISSANSSCGSVEENVTFTVKCQCICGISEATCDDSLLWCCGCEAVFHAECLQYDCPREFLCPHCALKRVRLYINNCRGVKFCQ